MAAQRRQPLVDLRSNIQSIYKSIRSIRDLEASHSSDQDVVNYINNLKADNQRLRLYSQTIKSNGGEVPASVTNALREAEIELRKIVRDYEHRNNVMTNVMGGSNKVRAFRDRVVGTKVKDSIDDYLRMHPNLPDDIDDILLDDNNFEQRTPTGFGLGNSKKANTPLRRGIPESYPITEAVDREIINIDDDVFQPNVPAALLLVRGILNGFPNWTSLLEGTKAQRNPQDQIGTLIKVEDGEGRYGQKLFMMDRISYWLTNRKTYSTDESSLRGRFTRYFSNDDKEFQILRNERASALIGQYDPYLPEGLLLNEPFLYFANVDRTFEEQKPFIDRTNRDLLTEGQVLSRLQLIDTETKMRQVLEQTNIVTLEDNATDNPFIYID